MSNTIAQKALELLEPIPASAWMTDDFTDGISKCCVVGHYTRLTSGDPNNFSKDNCSDYTNEWGFTSPLRAASRKFLWNRAISQHESTDITAINNLGYGIYMERDIKDRVIHLLKDMAKAGY